MSYRDGRKKLAPETDVCKRCDRPITDRKRLGFRKLWYCEGCKKKILIEKNHNVYRKTHSKKPFKHEKLLSVLQKRSATEPELLRLTKIKNRIALKTAISQLRDEGHNVVAIHFMPSHYVLVKP